MGKIVWNIHYGQKQHGTLNDYKSNAHMQDKECLDKKLPSRKGSKNSKGGEYGEKNKAKSLKKV